MSRTINTRTQYKIVGSDYSAQEPRLTTFLSGEPKMYDAYNNNKDLYAIIAQSAYHNEYGENLEFWPEGTELEIDGKKVITGHKTHLNPAGKKRRATGKLLNLATSYGMAAATAGAKMGLTGDEARVKGQELLDNFFAGFPKVHEAIEGSKEFLRKNGYVEDFVGRRRRLPDINMQPYEARLKDLKDEGATFNPFLGCSNKRTQNDPEEIWTVIMLAEAVLANARKLAIDVQSAKEDTSYKPVYKAEYSMANATFSKLKKIAANPEWYLDAKSFYDLDKKADKYSASCRERLMKDITAVKELMSTRSYKLQKGRQSTDVILPAHAEFDAILDRFRADCADKLPAFIPNDRVDLFAWTGRISQAARQCYNARVQGCLSGDSIVFTSEGPAKIQDLSGQSVQLWDGSAWTMAEVLPSGKKQKCILTTALGDKIICSPDHKFLTINTSGTTKFKKLSELKKQDRLVFESEMPAVTDSSVSLRDLHTSSIECKQVAHNRSNYSFEDIDNPYIRGQILGRIASDGSYIFRKEGSGAVYILVAEHEQELLEYFRANLPFKYSERVIQKKNQKIFEFLICSTSLAEECALLDIKHSINSYFYSDTDLLRGFISGFFDGDSTACNNQIHLDFGTQADFTKICMDFKHALNYLGIKNTWSAPKNRYRVSICRGASEIFAQRVGFITAKKQIEAFKKIPLKDNHTFKNLQVVCIKNIEFTTEYIEMYDACNTERGYFVVDGYITHNSAASLTKIAMVDISRDQELNDCQAKLIIPVHDELLMECPAYYADRVAKRLPEVMIAAAAEVGDDVPQACDPYVVGRWYADEYAAAILEEYQKLEKSGMDKAVARQQIFKAHAEIPQEAIEAVLTGETDQLEF